MSVTADEINFLIRRYLEESGYPHTAFIFKTESIQDRTHLQSNYLPPEAFLTILKKGMLYMQIEKAINEKAKADESPESIILSIIDAVRHSTPIVPSNSQPTAPKQIPAPSINVHHQAKSLDPISLPHSTALLLKAHSSGVLCCSWTPDGHYLATGSEDATAIIWEIRNRQYIQHYILDHASQANREQMSIASISWNPSGNLLATGSMDGSVRLYSSHGDLKFVLGQHNGSVYSVQFSPDGDYLLTGSQDSRVIVWDTKTGEARHIFAFHTGAILEVDWLDSSTFATASSDTRICVCTLSKPTNPLYLDGHTAEVNKIVWNQTGKALASCSDDTTVRVWFPFEQTRPIVLKGHTNHVYTIKWKPGDSNILISGAFDFTVRVWDVARQTCIQNITRHTNPIYSISFSPKGKYFATSGTDKVLCIWRASDFSLIASYQANSEIYDTQWDGTGQNIAMCLNDASVAVLSTSNLYLYQE